MRRVLLPRVVVAAAAVALSAAAAAGAGAGAGAVAAGAETAAVRARARVSAALPPRLAPPLAPPQSLRADACSPGAPTQAWTLRADGRLQSGGGGAGLCATPAAPLPVPDGTLVTMAACDAANGAQVFAYAPGGSISLVLAGQPRACLNLQDYGTSPGTTAWLYSCDAADCRGNCAWNATPPAPPPAPAHAALVNPASGLCLADGTAPAPLNPRPCSAGCPSRGLPFCNFSLPFGARVDDLYARLSPDARLDLFTLPIQPNAYNATLNVLSFYHDITCIQGLSPGRFSPVPNVTVLPNAIAQAASFDVALVGRLAQMTALEGRIVNQINYRLTGGTTFQGVNCDGGPLANTAHDPRWGRISETYGEDPFLSRALGYAATVNLQQRSREVLPGTAFLKTAQVTRHFIGFHGANDLPHDGEEWALPQWLEDQQLPGYELLQTPEADGGAGAEGLMCGYAAFAVAGDVPPPRNNATAKPYVPSCVNPFLMQTKLRDEWRSDSFVQGDCCGSIEAQVAHGYYDNLTQAVAASVAAGVAAAYEDYAGVQAALRAALADGSLDGALLDARLKRVLLLRFRLGEFDAANPANPFAGPLDEAALDGPAHRALAREAAAKGLVLLENRANLLPLDARALPARVAVVGAFSRCRVTLGDYGGHDHDDPNDCAAAACSYGHSYSGSTSAVSTIFDALAEEAARARGNATTVSWAPGSQSVTPCGDDGVAAAVALAQAAGVTVLVAGLGSLVEVESRDRASLELPPPQLALLQAVSAAVGPDRVVLVLVSAGGVDVDPALASTVLWGGYPGEETGHALADVLFGRAYPSGRLPTTWYREEYLQRVAPVADFNLLTARGGVGRTYRYYNATALGPPRYSFGYGLGYGVAGEGGGPPAAAFVYSVPAGARNASDGSFSLAVTVTFVGAALASGAPAREAAQVYVAVPAVAGLATPALKLCAFALLEFPPGGARAARAAFRVAPYDVSTVDARGARAVTRGAYTFFLGGHAPGDAAPYGTSNVVSVTVDVP